MIELNPAASLADWRRLRDRIVPPGVAAPSGVEDDPLRPATFDDFVGQPKTIRRLKIMIGGAAHRGDVLDHIMLSGPPGLGKTTLAKIIADQVGSALRVVTGPAVTRLDDLGLSDVGRGDILFIDEIHRLPLVVMEALLPVMEEFELDSQVGGRRQRQALQRFTLIGATTDPALVVKPMRDRFGHEERLVFYTIPELAKIVVRSAGLLGVELTEAASLEVAGRSLLTPRIANRLLSRVRDYAQSEGIELVDRSEAGLALDLFGVDGLGLDVTGRAILEVLARTSGPVGLSAVAATLGESEDTISGMYEPFLLRSGLIERTPRGRRLTPKGRTHALG